MFKLVGRFPFFCKRNSEVDGIQISWLDWTNITDGDRMNSLARFLNQKEWCCTLISSDSYFRYRYNVCLLQFIKFKLNYIKLK